MRGRAAVSLFAGPARGSGELSGLNTVEDGGTAEASPQLGADDFFREVNERIRELGERFGFGDETLELICECGDTTCTQHVSIASAEYRQVREAPGRRVVIVGHEHACRVVARNGSYVVVCD
jgi:hypothetical protein